MPRKKNRRKEIQRKRRAAEDARPKQYPKGQRVMITSDRPLSAHALAALTAQASTLEAGMLFPAEELPKTRRIFRMHVNDAGSGMIAFACQKCGHETGWITDKWTHSENKKGQPCPVCNREVLLPWQQLGIMEPEWHEAAHECGPFQLYMDFDETEWILTSDHEFPLLNTETLDLELAKKRAEIWIETLNP